jgi:hypothetical protein
MVSSFKWNIFSLTWRNLLHNFKGVGRNPVPKLGGNDLYTGNNYYTIHLACQRI